MLFLLITFDPFRISLWFFLIQNPEVLTILMMYNTLEGCTSFFLVIFAGYTAGRPRTRTAGKIFSLEKQDFYMCVHTFTYGRRKTFSTCDSCPGRLVLSPTFDRSARRDLIYYGWGELPHFSPRVPDTQSSSEQVSVAMSFRSGAYGRGTGFKLLFLGFGRI